MIRFLLTALVLCGLGYGGWWLSESHPEAKERLFQFLPARSFPTLEPRFTAQKIREQQLRLLRSEREPLEISSTLYHPFVLMEVKFTRPNQTTGEGSMLWDLVDGEMVLSTGTWEKSHGFADCIQTRADAHELKILNVIARHGNSIHRERLFQDLNLEKAVLDTRLNRLLKKKLIAHYQGTYRIHLEAPNMTFSPVSHLTFPLMTKNLKHLDRLEKKFSTSQIVRLAESAFGDDFAIRNTQEVYIPLYVLNTQDADGSKQTSYWNALTGTRLN